MGGRGTIVTTADSGAHWVQQISKTTEFLRGVAFAADGQHGWVVGDEGTILGTSDGGAHWALQASPIDELRSLKAVSFAADEQRAWAVSDNGTILQTVEMPSLESGSISLAGQAVNGLATVSFRMHGDPDMPIWRGEVQAKTEKGEWTFVGAAAIQRESGGNTSWHLSWRPDDHGFHPGDSIRQQVLIYAGELAAIPLPLGTLVFDPWWARVWRHHQTKIVGGVILISLVLLYATVVLLVLLVAPARLARVGPASLESTPAPTGNLAFIWGLLRKSLEAPLPWFCRNSRVRRAWVREYAAGQSKLGDLGKFARDRFVTEPEVLDAWVEARTTRIRTALESFELYEQRRNFVPLPVRIGAEFIVERPDRDMLQQTFARKRADVCIVGSGGSGKSTLACAIARWAMADDPKQRLATHKIIPLFISQDTNNIQDAILQSLRRMLGEEELPDDLIQGLLTRQRLLVIVDALSERQPETQVHIEGIFARSAIYNATVITPRHAPPLGEVERTLIYPLLIDQKRIVPFIIDYVAKLDNAEELQGGHTLLDLGTRVLSLAETNGHATSVTPLLVKLFVDSAMSRAPVATGLEGLPQDIPEIFIDYLKRIYAIPNASSSWSDVDEFLRGARTLARVSLGARLIPSDFSVENAQSALGSSKAGIGASALLDAFVSGGVIESRSVAGERVLRFALDPVAEYLAAIQFVLEQRGCNPEAVKNNLHDLTQVSGYPTACDGYLKAISICYQTYRSKFGLPEVVLLWECQPDQQHAR